MNCLLQRGNFISHSGLNLNFKIECDVLTKKDIDCIAEFIVSNTKFYKVIGIPTGGTLLAKKLEKHKTVRSNTILIVDDVLTTGKSMEDARQALRHDDIIGWVIFSRINPPDWINAMFTLYQS